MLKSIVFELLPVDCSSLYELNGIVRVLDVYLYVMGKLKITAWEKFTLTLFFMVKFAHTDLGFLMLDFINPWRACTRGLL